MFKRNIKISPNYKLDKEIGPDHDKVFALNFMLEKSLYQMERANLKKRPK